MNNLDINFDINGTVVSIRSCGIISNDDKILLHRKKCDDFYALVGGRVKTNESTIEAVKREYYEELNINVDVVKQLCCIENFFIYSGKKHHELMFVYSLKTNDKIPNESFIIEDNVFCWFDKNDYRNIKIKPNIFKKWEDFFSFNEKHIIITGTQLKDEDKRIERNKFIV